MFARHAGAVATAGGQYMRRQRSGLGLDAWSCTRDRYVALVSDTVYRKPQSSSAGK